MCRFVMNQSNIIRGIWLQAYLDFDQIAENRPSGGFLDSKPPINGSKTNVTTSRDRSRGTL